MAICRICCLKTKVFPLIPFPNLRFRTCDALQTKRNNHQQPQQQKISILNPNSAPNQTSKKKKLFSNISTFKINLKPTQIFFVVVVAQRSRQASPGHARLPHLEAVVVVRDAAAVPRRPPGGGDHDEARAGAPVPPRAVHATAEVKISPCPAPLSVQRQLFLGHCSNKTVTRKHEME